MSTNLPVTTWDLKPEDRALLLNDLSKLTPDKKSELYFAVCNSLGLNPLTQPLSIMKDKSGKEFFYSNRNCTDQLRSLRSVSLSIVARERVDDLYIVTARATLPNGRVDESVGAVPLAGLKGEQLANAIMKGETKAKRRVTLCICGLSFLDETEAETIRDATTVTIDHPVTIPIGTFNPMPAFTGGGATTSSIKTEIKNTEGGQASAHVAPNFLPPEVDPNRGKDELDEYLGIDMRDISRQIDEYTITFGKHSGKGLRDVGLHACEGYVKWIKESATKDGKEIRGQVLDFINMVDLYSKEFQHETDIQYWRANGTDRSSTAENQDFTNN